MQALIEASIRDSAEGKEAERILRSCVHCGFCTASCPTYQLLGDELDGPRGRIYLIKSMLGGDPVSNKTMQHLDRCLTCLACETSCPSGVEYGRLLDIGRTVVENKVSRSVYDRFFRSLLVQVLSYPERIGLLLGLARTFHFLLPKKLRQSIPKKTDQTVVSARIKHARQVILFKGCVQSVLNPNINQSAIKVLNHLGISAREPEDQCCCGALPQHLSHTQQAKVFMRKNIDAFWPLIQEGAEAIISTASGCGVHLKDYGYLLREDREYAEKALKLSALTRDLAEYMSPLDLDRIPNANSIRIAFQSPCTLQHGQKLAGVTETLLAQKGFLLTEIKDPHLCCGSAGVYSFLQKDIAEKLQVQKINNLLRQQPDLILTANIGCGQHLQQLSPVPVRHWVEELANLID